MYRTKYDWNYTTNNDGYANQALVGETVPWVRGRMLGGSAAINAMIYYRGNDHDYQDWYDQGNTDWHPDIVRKYFMKAESLQDSSLLDDDNIKTFYGLDGPLVVNTFNSTDKAVLDKVLESWDEIGIKSVPDLNHANVLGSGIFRVNAANGVRYSAGKAYLQPAKKRSNLSVMKNAFVNKVLINETTLEAYGVQVEYNGENISILSNLEVIVSTGAINTPQLLMLSGIGPKKYLTDKNIKTLVNLPAVGQNLQDHTIVYVPIFVNEMELASAHQLNFDAVQYLFNKKGYLAQNGFADISALYTCEKNGTYPLFQNHLVLFGKNSTMARTFFAKYKSTIFESIMKEFVDHPAFVFIFNLLHPYSMGNVSLSTSNAKDHPLIYANYFKDNRDLDATVTGIKMLTQIVNTEYFKSIGGYLGRMAWPACDGFELDSDDYWRCTALNTVVTLYHPVGTAKMGPNKTASVVDSHLRVHGVSKLRVVDASVMPSLSSGNTNGPVIMIGERASDLIKEDHNL